MQHLNFWLPFLGWQFIPKITFDTARLNSTRFQHFEFTWFPWKWTAKLFKVSNLYPIVKWLLLIWFCLYYYFPHLEFVNVPMPAYQILPLTAYIFEASYSTSATQANKIWSLDQSELLNPWAGIGNSMYCYVQPVHGNDIFSKNNYK